MIECAFYSLPGRPEIEGKTKYALLTRALKLYTREYFNLADLI